jgi:hypothetical protein
MRRALATWATEVGDTHVLGVVRVALGGLLFVHALTAAKDLLTIGYTGAAFHMALVPESLVPGPGVYTALVAARVLLAVLVTVGYQARPALMASALLCLVPLLVDRVGYHHNRYALACFALLLSLAPCDRAWIITGPSTTPLSRAGELWAARLAQLQLSIIYLSSSLSKLADPDWRGGRALGDRITRYAYLAIEGGVPHQVVDVISRPAMTGALSKLAIATELLLAVSLWPRRTRIYALWWGVMFHLTIEVTCKVEIFTWLTLAIYALFATPDVGARKIYFDRSRVGGVLLAFAVSMLDWLARFEVRPWEPDALRRGHALVVIRRDGSRATGIRALAMVARCVPALFPLWAPLAILARFSKGGGVSARA